MVEGAIDMASGRELVRTRAAPKFSMAEILWPIGIQ